MVLDLKEAVEDAAGGGPYWPDPVGRGIPRVARGLRGDRADRVGVSLGSEQRRPEATCVRLGPCGTPRRTH